MLHKLGEPFTISVQVLSESGLPIIDDIVIATIKDVGKNKFFNGLFWSDHECSILVSHKENGIYELEFIPETISSFEITIRSNKYPFAKSELLYTFEEGNKDSLVNIDSSSFMNQDLTDTKIIDSDGKAIVGATISCFDLKGEIISVTQSNENGEWAMIIPRGTYFFTFEKESYISVSFERTVV